MIEDYSFKEIYDYSLSVSKPLDAILHDLYRETHLKTLAPRMASGPLQGKFLYLLCGMLKPKRVLEIGTFTGYATICMAAPLKSDAEVITLEVNPELAHISNKYFAKAKVDQIIQPIVGDALQELEKLNGPYDLVFIDAKKRDYPTYYDLIIDKMKPGGLILADNVLWDGKVMEEEKDKTTQVIHDFNQKIKEDNRVDNLLLPLRDGVMMIRVNE